MEIEDVAEARGELEGALGRWRQRADLFGDQPGHVLAHGRGADPVDVPAPPAGLGVEGDEPVVVERQEELADQERVALGALRDQRAELPHGRGRGLGGHRIGHELLDVGGPEGTKGHGLDGGAPGAERLDGDRERVGGRHLVVAVRPHQQQVPRAVALHEEADQLDRGEIRVLEVVEEQGHRVVQLRERFEQAPEDQPEAVLRLGRPQRRDGRLRAYDERELGDHVDQDAAVGSKGGEQTLAPARHLVLALPQDLPEDPAQRLDEAAVRARVDLRVLAG